MVHEDTIEVGDTVTIRDLNGHDTLNCATVLHVPVLTGDSWQLRAAGGQLVYVQQFGSMWRRVKAS